MLANSLNRLEFVMGLLSWIVFGFLAGALARWFLPGQAPGGCVLTIAIGVIGAAIGGWAGVQLGLGAVNSFDLRSLALAVLGSVVLLAILGAVQPRA